MTLSVPFTEEAFEVAKAVIQEMRPDADSFYLVESEIDDDGDYVLKIGESLGLIKDDIGEPFGFLCG